MFVWHWVQQHRVISVIVLAVFIVGSAGGTTWALVFRTVSSPVGLAQALRLYRREQMGKVMSSLRSRMPQPGVYAYATEGGEGLNLVGVQRSFPASSSMVVTDGSCATVSWVPIEQHTETTTFCPGASGSYQIPQLVTDESIAGTSSTSDISCPSTAYLLPPHASTGEHWSAICSQASPSERVGLSGQVLGPATIDVGGQAIGVEHVRVTLTFSGSQRGTNPTDYWLLPSTGLVVREKEQVSVASGAVTYSENMETMLTSLRPSS